MVEKTFAPKEIIYREGDSLDVAYVVLGGKIDLLKTSGREDVVIASVSTGQGLGEEALLEGYNSRTHTARAVEPTKVQILSSDEFDQFLSQSPQPIQAVLHALARHAKPKTTHSAAPEVQTPSVKINDISKILISPAKDSPEKLFAPAEFLLARLPLRVGGYSPQAGEEPVAQNHINVPCEGPPLKVSKQHFEIVIENDALMLIDQGSRFCSIVNNKPIGRGLGQYSAPLQKGVNHVVLGGKNSPYKLVIECI